MPFLWLLIFLAALTVLIFAAGRFTKAAEQLGFLLGIPAFIVGVTIVSIGTSLPDLLINLLAVFKSSPLLDTTTVVASKTVGSNVANILIIIGLTTLFVRKLQIRRSLVELEIPLLILSTALFVIVSLDGRITWMEGVLLLAGFLIYLRYSFSDHAREDIKMGNEVEQLKRPIWGIFRKRSVEVQFQSRLIFSLLFYSILLYVGAHYTIESLVALSEHAGIGLPVLAASIIAVGASLPEIFVSVTAARRGNHDIAMGTIFGSNIFNVFFIVGLPALIHPLTVSPDMSSFGIPFLMVVTVAFVFSSLSGRVYVYEGMIYLLLYVAFVAKLYGIF